MHIFPIDLNDYHRKYVITAPGDFNLKAMTEIFLRVSKIDPDKYAGKLLANLLEAFFGELEDVATIYESYYTREYECIEEYMYKKMLMETAEIEYIISKVKDGEKIYYTNLEYTSDNNYENLFDYEDQDLLAKINDILEVI